LIFKNGSILWLVIVLVYVVLQCSIETIES